MDLVQFALLVSPYRGKPALCTSANGEERSGIFVSYRGFVSDQGRYGLQLRLEVNLELEDGTSYCPQFPVDWVRVIEENLEELIVSYGEPRGSELSSITFYDRESDTPNVATTE